MTSPYLRAAFALMLSVTLCISNASAGEKGKGKKAPTGECAAVKAACEESKDAAVKCSAEHKATAAKDCAAQVAKKKADCQKKKDVCKNG